MHIVIDFSNPIFRYNRSDAKQEWLEKLLFLTPQTAMTESVDRFLFGDGNLFNIFEFIFFEFSQCSYTILSMYGHWTKSIDSIR